MARKRSKPQSTRSAARPVLAAADTAANRHLVYVHGICRHDAGYSDPWWAALQPFAPTIPDENRHEVLWSDLITPADRAMLAPHAPARLQLALAQLQPPVGGRQPTLADDIRDVLLDRAQRQHIVAAGPAVAPLTAAETLSAQPFMLAEPAAPVALFGLPDFECIDDFMRYLLDDNIRDAVMDRFDAVARPLLESGAQVEVISHSWGTVVAYEALRRLDAAAALPDQAIPNFFTVGAALAIPPVKRRLLPIAIDGQRPRLVRTWINLNARFDIVGGALAGNPFAVDAEFLNLPPVGCSQVIPNPSCAHGSYFRTANLAVNRDIFGKYIAI